MEQLIEFLTSNFQFVIVIIGIAYFLFFRKSPLEKQSTNRMPDFGGEARRRSERPVQPPQEARIEREPEPARRAYFADESPSMASSEEPEEFVSPVLSAAVSKRTNWRAAGRETDAVLDKEDLARAVLWSEILGRPRARKPHRR